ncbi:hypothetical protein MMC34_001075 [Xylographa carneopallida]|nr:hypothetical protein [Xylographa carneopallida]
MSSPNLLITGATGHIGFRVLVEALKAGYSVRAAIRSEGKAPEILATPSIKALAPGNKLSFVVVPDILAEGAYDEALKGVTYVVHLASPLANPSDDMEQTIVQPAIIGTTGILYSALKVPTIKRVVITSSVVAVLPLQTMLGTADFKVHTAEDRQPAPEKPYGHPFVAYAASKVKALAATEDFVRAEKPHFDINNIHPGFVIGANELATSAEGVIKGTNGMMMGQVLGAKSDQPRMSGTVHLHDVAKVHILALDLAVKGGQSFAAIKNNVWNDALRYVKKHFPEAVESGKLPANGDQPTLNIDFDASKTEEAFGFKFQDYEAQTVSVVEQYLSLLG